MLPCELFVSIQVWKTFKTSDIITVQGETPPAQPRILQMFARAAKSPPTDTLTSPTLPVQSGVASGSVSPQPIAGAVAVTAAAVAAAAAATDVVADSSGDHSDDNGNCDMDDFAQADPAELAAGLLARQSTFLTIPMAMWLATLDPTPQSAFLLPV